MVELVPGYYGVRLSQRQLDKAVDNSSGSPGRLVRNLMRIFFSKEMLATFQCPTNQALDPDIIGACLRKNYLNDIITQLVILYFVGFVLSKHQISPH